MAGGIIVAVALLVVAVLYLRHFSIPVLEPRGTIARQERNLIYFGSLLSIIIIVPVFALTFMISWKYREANTKATYSPEFDHSRKAETIWWLIPTILIVILSVVTWNSSHQLDPFKPLASDTAPLTIQVVALDWKWLFIYPQQNIASVNMVQFPVNTPVHFVITSDAPMNSFWIPQLGGQIYAMPGMSTQLHLMASQSGSYRGSSANISGRGFADMNFTAKATSNLDFRKWVNTVKQSPNHLTADAYAELSKPSDHNTVAYYASNQPGLYDSIVIKYMTPGALGVVQ